MNTKKLRLALIGKDVKDSKSGEMHRFIVKELGADCDYELVSVEKESFERVFPRLIAEKDGINVTVPYKQTAIPFLDSVLGDASACGAVNTVVIGRGSVTKATGFNTDGLGFMQMLEREKIPVKDRRVVVFGAGGSGRSVAAAMRRAGAEVFLTRKNRTLLDAVCDELQVKKAPYTPQGEIAGNYDIFVNCTGVGMHETEGVSPVTEKEMEKTQIAVDLIYRPAKSAFLSMAEKQGKRTLNGEAMLFYQAYYADCLYLNVSANARQATELYEKYLKLENE